jgi:hypothetical protein
MLFAAIGRIVWGALAEHIMLEDALFYSSWLFTHWHH